ncbi:MAG: winged helix-turn-helix transcriptional regulator, partial [Thermoplasmata archaeon]
GNCRSIDIGRTSGKLYVSSDKNLTIYNQKINVSETIFINNTILFLAVDKDENIAYIGDYYKLYRLFLKNKTVQFVNKEYYMTDIKYHKYSNNFIFLYYPTQVLSTDLQLSESFPETGSINSIYTNPDSDILYILTGYVSYGGSFGTATSSEDSVKGIIIFNLGNYTWNNYTIWDRLPIGNQYGFTVDPLRNTIHFVGEKYYAVMNISDLSKTFIKPEVQLIKIKPGMPTEEASSRNRIYFGIICICSISVISFLYSYEPTKYKFIITFAVPYYTRLKKENLLDHKTRGRIIGVIETEPGVHYNALKKQLKLNNGTLSYHLNVLEKEEQVKSKNSGKYKHFFPFEMTLPKKIFKMNDVQKIIFKKVLENPGISQKSLTDKIGSSTSTVNYNVKIMVKKEILALEKVGSKTNCYIMTEDGRIEKDIE